jgi:hypothetical protein
MAKYLKDVLGKNTTTKKTNDLGVYKPKAGDEQKFAKKHEIEVHDHTPAPEYQFSGGKSEAAYNKQSDGVYESKKAEDVSCNHTPAGTKCPLHEMADCSTVRNIKELSTDLLHRAAHKAAKVAMTDVQGRSGPIFKKRAAQANKFRDKGMAQEKKERAVKEEAFDEKERSQSELTAKWAHHSNQAYLTKQKAKTALKGAEGSKDPKDYDIAGDYQRKAQLHKKAAGIAGKAIKEEEAVEEAYGSNAGKTATGTKWSDNSVSVSVHHDGKKHTFTGKHDYVAKKLKTAHGIGMHQVNFKKASDMKEESLEEISTKLALSYAKGASKSMDTAAAKGSAGHETFMKRSAGHKLALDKTNPEHKRLKAKVGTTDANAKDAAYKKAIGEGANVDRMVAHVKSSEKAAGKSEKKAESIAWATANKRGMLDNKNKKMNEDLAVPLLQGDSHSDEAVEMVKAELKALANKAMHLVMQMPSSMHVEPWCQAKIANAKSYVNDVHDYMIYGDHKKEEYESDTPMDITTASSPPNTSPNFAADVDTGRNV